MRTSSAPYRISLWKRTFSFIIDLLIINLIIIYPFKGLLEKYFGNMTFAEALNSAEKPIPLEIYLAMFAISLLALLYFTILEYYFGQSAGQALMRIKSVSTDLKKRKITFWRALISNCFIIPFFPFYILWIVELINLAIYKERFLERITRTKTIHEFEKFKISEYKLKKV